MPEAVLATPAPAETGRPEPLVVTGHHRLGRRLSAWLAVAPAVIGIAVAWILLTHMRPSFDAFGWLDWGRQVLHWNLNTDAAPSWKPLPFLFTFPYALAGPNAQLWLWMITATATAGASSVFAARIAFRLAGPASGRPWARWIAALFAGVGVLAAGPTATSGRDLNSFVHQVLIANSDPMVQSLCLAAVDAHLCRRRRLALILLLLAGLGRPEAWAFVVLYAAYLWRADPAARGLAVASVLAIPAAWFIVPGLTSHSWFIAGDRALGSQYQVHGFKAAGVIARLRSLYPLPAQLALLVALGLALVRRDRSWFALFAAAALWVIVEIGFAYHGWSAVPRYLLEPGALLVVLAATGVGWVLAYAPPGRAALHGVLLAAELAALVGFVVALVPAANRLVHAVQPQLPIARRADTQLSRLEAVIAIDGGPAAIKRCGQPVTQNDKQSELAWAIGLNVGKVGFAPGRAIASGLPIVYFWPHDSGWRVRPFHVTARCEALRTDSAVT